MRRNTKMVHPSSTSIANPSIFFCCRLRCQKKMVMASVAADTNETLQLIADLIDCDRRDHAQVCHMLQRIKASATTLVEANATRYLYENDAVSTRQQPQLQKTDSGCRIGDEHVNDESAGDGQDESDANDMDEPETGIQMLQRHCSPWLVSVLNRPPKSPHAVADHGDDDDAAVLDEISNIMSLLCGRNATGACTTTWNLQNTGVFRIAETTYTEAEIGFQTWGGGIMLAKMIDQKVIDVTSKSVLELGCGTGLAGMVSARAGSRLTVLTDYHPTVLDNAQRNVEANGVESAARVVKLDWLWCIPREQHADYGIVYAHGGDHETEEERAKYAQETPPEMQDPVLADTDFDMVIAADCIFDSMHSLLVPKVAKKYLSRRQPGARFHVILPHRDRFKSEIQAFEENMPKEGWILESSQWIEKATINFRYYVYRL